MNIRVLFAIIGMVVVMRATTSTCSLHDALYAYHPGVQVAKLLSHGVDVNQQNNEGKTPLFYASDYGFDLIVKQLINAGADVNYRDNEGQTPLHHAVMRKRNGFDWMDTMSELAYDKGQPAIVQLLIQAGARVNELDKYKRTPLGYAAECGQVDAARQLIAAGADVNLRAPYGPLYLACSSCGGTIEMVRFLVASGARLAVVDRHGQNPLQTAAVRDDQIYRFLKQCGELLILGESQHARLGARSPLRMLDAFTINRIAWYIRR